MKHNLIILCVYSVLLVGCQPAEIVLNEVGVQTISYEEIVSMNNCGGKGESEQTAKRSYSSNIEGEGIIKAGYQQIVQGELSVKYGQHRSAEKTIRLVAPPGTNMEFVLKWSEQEFAGNVVVNGEKGNYNIRVPIAVELVSSRDKNCSNTELGTTPPIVEEPPESNFPRVVGLPGTFQTQLGCADNWLPDCFKTFLSYDLTSLVYRVTLEISTGEYEYKIALNRDWAENYGMRGEQDGQNILLSLAENTFVTFYYSDETHWITDNINSIIANVPGSFQDEIGCPGDWMANCLRSWLQDPDGDGIYTFITTQIPPGDYEVKVAYNESWAENYGEGGLQNGPNIPFTVGEHEKVTFSWRPQTKFLTVTKSPAP